VDEQGGRWRSAASLRPAVVQGSIGPGPSSMEAHSLGLGDSFDEGVQERAATALVGMLSLSLQEGDELGTGLEEAAALGRQPIWDRDLGPFHE
jgi:hypothetical protein